MPPKKSTKASTDGGANGGGETKSGFAGWTPENDLKLLYAICVIPTVPAKEQAELTVAMGCNPSGIRNRITKLRADQKKAREELGRPLPNAADAVTPAKSKEVPKPTSANTTSTNTNPAKATPRKRKMDKDVDGASSKKGKFELQLQDSVIENEHPNDGDIGDDNESNVPDLKAELEEDIDIGI